MSAELARKATAYMTRERKVDVLNIPLFKEALKKFESDDIRSLAKRGLEIAPLQFWIMPASMNKLAHHTSEHGVGDICYSAEKDIHVVNVIGGKAYHTIRVFNIAEILLEADAPEVKDYNGNIKAYKYGNEFTSRERDIIRLACLWHDIFSGGTEDEFDTKRKGLDKNHSMYHRTEYDHLKVFVNEDEWALILDAIEMHMWKWFSKDTVQFHAIKEMSTVEEAYAYMRRYRVIKLVEMADLIAANNF